jgi:hypothetical protein
MAVNGTDDVFLRWERRHPEAARNDVDPRSLAPCAVCGRTFAWRGYGSLCGWCYEEAESKEVLSRDLDLADARIAQLERQLVAAGVMDPELGP